MLYLIYLPHSYKKHWPENEKRHQLFLFMTASNVILSIATTSKLIWSTSSRVSVQLLDQQPHATETAILQWLLISLISFCWNALLTNHHCQNASRLLGHHAIASCGLRRASSGRSDARRSSASPSGTSPSWCRIGLSRVATPPRSRRKRSSLFLIRQSCQVSARQ